MDIDENSDRNLDLAHWMLIGSFCAYAIVSISYGPRREKTSLRGFANNTGADQPGHPRRLISAFVISLSRSIISRLAMSEISIFKLVSVAEETGLILAVSETSKTDFLGMRPICCSHAQIMDVDEDSDKNVDL